MPQRSDTVAVHQLGCLTTCAADRPNTREYGIDRSTLQPLLHNEWACDRPQFAFDPVLESMVSLASASKKNVSVICN